MFKRIVVYTLYLKIKPLCRYPIMSQSSVFFINYSSVSILENKKLDKNIFIIKFLTVGYDMLALDEDQWNKLKRVIKYPVSIVSLRHQEEQHLK